jgi:hypothetical protein
LKFVFETENLNERVYKRICNYYILTNFGLRTWKRLDSAIITIRPSERIGEEPFFDPGSNGTGGVTDRSGCKLYLFDNKDLNLFLRTNATTVTHELAHLALLHRVEGSRRVPLRNNDLSGNKEGKMLNYSTAEVHDRHIENHFNPVTIWVWVGLRYRRLQYLELDFRDHYRK